MNLGGEDSQDRHVDSRLFPYELLELAFGDEANIRALAAMADSEYG
jgi:hypothetical protein